MVKPILLVMAAGMGSRYGGLKQIDPVGPRGEIIIHYSLIDAYKAGFRKVVFIIRPEMEADFREVLGETVFQSFEVEFAYQSVDDLPLGYSKPIDRTKPWGTGHAVWSARQKLNQPFAAINADDFYGREAFAEIFNFLLCAKDDEVYHYGMVGYTLSNTLTEYGHVARGVCEVQDGYLHSIVERTHIIKTSTGASYTEDQEHFYPLPFSTTVSMNFWGFTPAFLKELELSFIRFLEDNTKDELKSEFFLPSVVNQLIDRKKAMVNVMLSQDKWYGVTYAEDKPVVVAAIQQMIAAGIY